MAVDTALINWNVLLKTPADGPLPQVWVPAYALYGGPGYSGGEVIDEEGEVPDFSVKPANKIDAYFRLHDLVYYDLEATEFERSETARDRPGSPGGPGETGIAQPRPG